MARLTRFLLAAMSTATLAGCLPTSMPAFVNNGRTIVAMAKDPNGRNVLWTCDVSTGVATAHRPDKAVSAQLARALASRKDDKAVADGELWLDSARSIGGQVWVTWGTDLKDDKGSVVADLSFSMRFDPNGNTFVPGPGDLACAAWTKTAILASYDGQRCVFLPTKENSTFVTFVARSFPKLERMTPKTLYLDDPISAGNCWWLMWTSKGYFLFEPTGEIRKPHIFALDEVAKAKNGERGLLKYVRGSRDGKVLLLVFTAPKQQLSFGLFDVATGKFLWGKKDYDGGYSGIPMFNRNELWNIE